MTRASFTFFLFVAITAVLMAAQPGTSKFSAALAERPDVTQALSYIDDHFDAQVKEWITLTEIPAPSTHEEKRAAYIRGQLEAMGLKPTIDGIGNVIARRAGTGGGPAIAFVAHMDTVHPLGTDVTVKRLPDGTLHAPGVLDDTPSDVALLQTLRAIDAAKIRTKGDLILIFSVQEEIGLKGMLYWQDHNPKAADMIVAVDAELGAVDYGALGIYWSKMIFSAAGAHTLNSLGVPHPARAAAQCISDIYSVPLPPADALVGAIYNVGMIGGGTVVNAVAPEVWFTVDLRTIDPVLLTKLDGEIVGKCETAAKLQKVAFKREFIQKSEAGGRPEQLADRRRHPVVRTAVDVLTYLGIPILPNGAPAPTGSTDANVGVTRGIPSIAIGRGRGGNQHSLSEWADIESTRAGTKQIVLLAVALAEIR